MSTTVAIHPIHTDADLSAALARIETLMGADAGTPASDELEILTDLVHAYEERRHPAPGRNPRRVLLTLMEANNLAQSDLPEVGSQGVVSEILAGRRELNVRQIRALAKRFRVSPAAFVR